MSSQFLSGEYWRLCLHCFKRKPDLKRCSRCQVAYYCSEKCQKSSWSHHKGFCLSPSYSSEWKRAVIGVLGHSPIREMGDFPRIAKALELSFYAFKALFISCGALDALFRMLPSPMADKDEFPPSNTCNLFLFLVLELVRGDDGPGVCPEIAKICVTEFDIVAKILDALLSPFSGISEGLKQNSIICIEHMLLEDSVFDSIDAHREQILKRFQFVISSNTSLTPGISSTICLWYRLLERKNNAKHLSEFMHDAMESVDMKLVANSASGNLSKDGAIEIGAVDLLTCVLAFCRAENEDHRIANDVNFLQTIVFCFFDMLIIPKPSLRAMGLYGLALLASSKIILQIILHYKWFTTTLENNPNRREKCYYLEKFSTPISVVVALVGSESSVRLRHVTVDSRYNALYVLNGILSYREGTRMLVDCGCMMLLNGRLAELKKRLSLHELSAPIGRLLAVVQSKLEEVTLGA